MAQIGEATIKVSADTTAFKRDIKQAQRRVFWHGVFLPMCAGAVTGVFGFVVGFLFGVSA